MTDETTFRARVDATMSDEAADAATGQPRSLDELVGRVADMALEQRRAVDAPHPASVRWR